MILERWMEDVPAQFRNKKNIKILMSAFADELEEVYKMQQQLKQLTDIEKCEGKNLDTIGVITSMARKDAYVLLEKDKDAIVTDENYRNVLRYKILQNTSDGTYKDIVQGIRLLWGDYQVHYREDDRTPATYYLDLGTYPIDDTSALLKRTLTIRASGVRVIFELTWQTDNKWKSDMRTYVSKANFHLRIKHFRDVRTWDGSWKIDGTYKLDAAQQKEAHVGYYMKIPWEKADFSLPHIYDIPGRLKVVSNEIRVVQNEAAIIALGGNSFAASFYEDGLSISASGDGVVSNDREYFQLKGNAVQSSDTRGYLVSEKYLSSTFKDDGVVITYAGAAELSLEPQTTYL